MTRLLVVGLLCAWCTIVGHSQAPVFRADADTVVVNASVRKGNAPVQGLTPADFRLYDNDVPQQVAAVSIDAVPVDVSIVVDTSGSAFPDVETTRQAVRGMVGFLRSTDRFRVLTMGNSVISAIPWQRTGPPDTSNVYLVMGQISLVADVVFAALLHRVPSDRRHLVVALTDGEDFCSLISADALRRGAERSGAVLHWIRVERKRGQESVALSSPGVRAYCLVTSNPLDLRPALSDAVRLTGGTERIAWYAADRVAVDAFDQIFDDFRRSYILHYIPRGVSATGWHRLRVETVAKGYTVRARTGYWASMSRPATQPAPSR